MDYQRDPDDIVVRREGSFFTVGSVRMEVGVGHLGRSPQFPEQDGQGDDGWARGHQPVSWATSHAVETADVNTGDYFKDKDTLLVRQQC